MTNPHPTLNTWSGPAPLLRPGLDLGRYLADDRLDVELWAFEYQVRRYLEHLSTHALVARLTSVRNNMAAMVAPHRDALPSQEFRSPWYWFRKLHHVGEEIRLRDLKVSNTPVPTGCDLLCREPPLRPRYPGAADFVVRYGKLSWLEPMLEHGRIRISPASAYAGAEMNAARRDEELTRQSHSPGAGVSITTADGRAIPVIGGLTYTTTFNANYYMLCTAHEFEWSLFPAFEADGCLLIRDPDEFGRRLGAAFGKLRPGWGMHQMPVMYYDPYERPPHFRPSPPVTKDFSFTSQHEYRFFWMPPAGQFADEALTVDIGDLRDIAELYRFQA